MIAAGVARLTRNNSPACVSSPVAPAGVESNKSFSRRNFRPQLSVTSLGLTSPPQEHETRGGVRARIENRFFRSIQACAQGVIASCVRPGGEMSNTRGRQRNIDTVKFNGLIYDCHKSSVTSRTALHTGWRATAPGPASLYDRLCPVPLARLPPRAVPRDRNSSPSPFFPLGRVCSPSLPRLAAHGPFLWVVTKG